MGLRQQYWPPCPEKQPNNLGFGPNTNLFYVLLFHSVFCLSFLFFPFLKNRHIGVACIDVSHLFKASVLLEFRYNPPQVLLPLHWSQVLFTS